eukprot:scaffold179818_cov19-Tisochrysis_lutea.AAC.1
MSESEQWAGTWLLALWLSAVGMSMSAVPLAACSEHGHGFWHCGCLQRKYTNMHCGSAAACKELHKHALWLCGCLHLQIVLCAMKEMDMKAMEFKDEYASRLSEVTLDTQAPGLEGASFRT